MDNILVFFMAIVFFFFSNKTLKILYNLKSP